MKQNELLEILVETLERNNEIISTLLEIDAMDHIPEETKKRYDAYVNRMRKTGKTPDDMITWENNQWKLVPTSKKPEVQASSSLRDAPPPPSTKSRLDQLKGIGNSGVDYAKANPYKTAAAAAGTAAVVGAGVYGAKALRRKMKLKRCMQIENKNEREACLRAV